MVKTVIRCKKLSFLHGKSKKQEKEAGINYVLLYQLRNVSANQENWFA